MERDIFTIPEQNSKNPQPTLLNVFLTSKTIIAEAK